MGNKEASIRAFPSKKLRHIKQIRYQIRSDQSLSCVRLFATPWIAACQASLSITNSRSSFRPTSIESVMPYEDSVIAGWRVSESRLPGRRYLVRARPWKWIEFKCGDLGNRQRNCRAQTAWRWGTFRKVAGDEEVQERIRKYSSPRVFVFFASQQGAFDADASLGERGWPQC